MLLAAVSVLILVIVLVLVVVLVIVLVAVLVIVLVIVLVAVLVVLILLVILVLILIVHNLILRIYLLGFPLVVCPNTQDLSLGLKIRLIIRPKTIAAAIPPAVALKPPVKMPRNPSLVIASFTPFARLYPKPVRGTVAPAPAYSTRGS